MVLGVILAPRMNWIRYIVLILTLMLASEGFAQFVIDLEKIQCNTDSTSVRMYQVNHTDSNTVKLQIWNYLSSPYEEAGCFIDLPIVDTISLNLKNV
jgi:P pilus assembly chaperone PapD